MGAFVSHDGDGTEVFVTTSAATLTRLDEKETAANAVFSSTNPKVTHPLNGWFNKDEPIYETLKSAVGTDRVFEVRIEATRKPGIDRATPIMELRKSLEEAKKNTLKRLVGVDGYLTKEALTNPAADPTQEGKPTSALTQDPPSRPTASGATASGAAGAGKGTILEVIRNSATNQDIPTAVMDVLKAQALVAGATIHEINEAGEIVENRPTTVQNSFSKEAPSFKDYNSDGRLNLGNGAVSGAVGVYAFLAEKLSDIQITADLKTTLTPLADILLSIADRVQTSAYGQGSHPDRSASSHTRARSLVYAAINSLNSENKLPVTASGALEEADVLKEWVVTVGKEAQSLFLAAVNSSQNVMSVNEALSKAHGTPQQTPTVEEPKSAAVQKVEEQLARIASVDPETPEEPAQPEPEWTVPAVEVTVTSGVAIPQDTMPEGSDAVEIYPQNLLPPGAINAQNAPDEELLEEFKQFVMEESGLKEKSDLANVSRLLAWTFGRNYNKAANIPKDVLGEFLDFYVAAGAENFKTAVTSV